MIKLFITLLNLILSSSHKTFKMKNMRKIFTLITLITTFILSASTQNIAVLISGIEKPVGNIIVSIFDDASSFPIKGKEWGLITVPADAESVKIPINDIEPGEYAFAVLHDINANGNCDSNLIGMPKEPFGFSNNVKPKLKVPSFDQVKVNVTDGMIIKIRLIKF